MKMPFLRRKIAHSTSAPSDGAQEDLPRWNLENLYPGLHSRELAEDQERAEGLISAFNGNYEDGVAWLSGEELGEAIAAYEEIEALRHKIYSYTYLLEQENSANIPRNEPLRKWMTETGDKLSFFEAEINDMAETDLIAKLAAPALSAYAPWIASVRADRGYLLGNDVETMSRDLSAASDEALVRLYHQTLAQVRVPFKGESLLFDRANDLMGEPGTSPADRAVLRRELAEGLKRASPRMAVIYNALVKSQMIDADLRKYARPDQWVNMKNRVDGKTVDTMSDTIKASYGRLSHRYFRWQADQRKAETLPRGQMLASLPGEPPGPDRTYGWEEAKKIVLRAFRKFTPKFSRLAQRFFDEGHIDAEPRPGKDTGGFAMPTGPDNFPYILINYTGKTEDVVSSLGHELGHGVHQALAEKARGMFLSDMPTTVAETASIFAEMLVFEELLRGEKDPAARKKLLMEKVENMLDNSLRQVSYYDFERRMHAERRQGEVDPERISDIWMETQRAYFGPAVALDDCDRYRWMTIPHFFDTPFYVYSYSFAQVAVSGLFQAYKRAEKEGPAAREEFIQNYIALLETGSTKSLYEMFRPFDLDPETPEFWEKGLSLMEKYLDDLSRPGGPVAGLADKFNRPEAGPAVKTRRPRGPHI